MLSPQIYIVKFDKTLIYNLLDHTSHKVSSLVIADTKAKAQKRDKNEGERGENAPHGSEGSKREKGCKKGREQW